MFLTAELILTVLFLAAEKSKATFLAPVAIGLALFVSELAGIAEILTFDESLILTVPIRCLLHRRLTQSCAQFWT